MPRFRFREKPLVFQTDPFEVAIEGGPVAGSASGGVDFAAGGGTGPGGGFGGGSPEGVASGADSTTDGDSDAGTPSAAIIAAIINAPFSIITQPADQTGVIGGLVDYSVVLAGGSGATFQWQISYDGTTWFDLWEDAAFYIGTQTDTLQVLNLDVTLCPPSASSCHFRVKVTKSATTLTSSAAALSIPYFAKAQDGPTPDALGYSFASAQGVIPFTVATGTTQSHGGYCAVTGGTAPYTFSWALVSGGGPVMSVADPTLQNPVFSAQIQNYGIFSWARWRCTVIDFHGNITESDDLLVIISGFPASMAHVVRNTGNQDPGTFVAPTIAAQLSAVSSAQIIVNGTPPPPTLPLSFSYQPIDVYSPRNSSPPAVLPQSASSSTTRWNLGAPLKPGQWLISSWMIIIADATGAQRCGIVSSNAPISPWQPLVNGPEWSYR